MHQVAEEEKNTKMVIREGREDDVFKYTFKNCFDNDDDRLIMFMLVMSRRMRVMMMSVIGRAIYLGIQL